MAFTLSLRHAHLVLDRGFIKCFQMIFIPNETDTTNVIQIPCKVKKKMNAGTDEFARDQKVNLNFGFNKEHKTFRVVT